MAETLRGLAIGAGYFARFHFDAWRRVEGAELVGVCDANVAKAKAACDEYGIAIAIADAETAIKQLEPDFVDIITPPHTHIDLVALAARYQTPVICQKPVAPDFSTAVQLFDVADAAGIPLMIHENFRFQPWHREIKQLIDAGAIGESLHSLSFRTRTGDGWGDDAYLARQPYFREMKRLLIHETGGHFVDTFRYLAGEIDSTTAVLRRMNSVIAGEDAGLVTFRFSHGAVGVWDANRFNESTDKNPRLTFGEFLVEGDAGSLRLYGDGRITLQSLGEAEREHDYSFSTEGFAGDCVRATQQHFVDCLRSGEEFETSGHNYQKTLQAVEAIYDSASIQQTVYLSSAAAPRIVDLTRPIDAELPGVSITPAKTIESDGWNATTLSLYSHSGTHMDAPCHFVPGGSKLTQQKLEVCAGLAKVIDLTPVQPGELLTVERLGRMQQRIVLGDRLLLRTDWSLRYPEIEYRNALPRISQELAEWFVEVGVVLVGVEPPSVADVNNIEEVTEVHKTLFNGGVTIVEGLVNLDQLDCEQVELIVLPLPIVGGDGSPVRAIAKVPSKGY